METTVTKEDIYKELDLIQSCITRMASNSFSMKGWHIGTISYYLVVERKYRWKYAWVIKNRVNANSPKADFLFDLNPDKEEMWEVDINSKGYKVAKQTKEACKNEKRNGFMINLCMLREVMNVMFSNTMEIQYFVVFVISALSYLCYII